MYKPYYPMKEKILQPTTFDTMTNVVEKLVKGFKFVRVDLYEVNGQVYFGEMTFYPDAGYGQYASGLHDYLFGKELDLNDATSPY